VFSCSEFVGSPGEGVLLTIRSNLSFLLLAIVVFMAVGVFYVLEISLSHEVGGLIFLPLIDVPGLAVNAAGLLQDGWDLVRFLHKQEVGAIEVAWRYGFLQCVHYLVFFPRSL
jgi:hypothetical protein